MPYDEWFLGEISVTAFPFPPRGWAMCDGQLLPISANQALFALLGVTYGGDGMTTFALPDLRGRTPLHRAADIPSGSTLGTESVVLTVPELPAHTHVPRATAEHADDASPAGARWGATRQQAYATGGTRIQMDPSAVGSAGAGQPHPNLAPYLGLNFVIALTGVFPARQ